MTNNYTETDPKVTRAFTISTSNSEWINKKVADGNRSSFVDDAIAHYIKLQERRARYEQQNRTVVAVKG